MTIQQLRTAMEAARTGSITQAAKNLYLSQPNASSMLRTLEQELGYEIFSRTNSGIVPTEAGERFLEHAKVILAQLQELYTIRAQGRVCRLRLGVQSFSPAVEAFIRLTQQYRDCPSAEFKCVNISADGGIRALADMELDVVAALIAPCMLPAAEQAVQNQNLELHFLHQVPACLNLRRGHPLLAKLPPNAETFDYRLLEAYPYVEYRSSPRAPTAIPPSARPTRSAIATGSWWTSAIRAAASSARRTRSPSAAACRRLSARATSSNAFPSRARACACTASPAAAAPRTPRSPATSTSSNPNSPTPQRSERTAAGNPFAAAKMHCTDGLVFDRHERDCFTQGEAVSFVLRDLSG